MLNINDYVSCTNDTVKNSPKTYFFLICFPLSLNFSIVTNRTGIIQMLTILLKYRPIFFSVFLPWVRRTGNEEKLYKKWCYVGIGDTE